MNARINHLAVWILVAVHQLVGWGWYTIFGDMWLNLHAKTMTDIESPHDIPSHLMALAASIVVNYALAWLIGRMNAHTAGCGFAIAFNCWFAFLFAEYATMSMFSAFGTNPWPLILIDMGRPLIAFSISGLVLGAWRRTGTAA
jgi:hypothetical protein